DRECVGAWSFVYWVCLYWIVFHWCRRCFYHFDIIGRIWRRYNNLWFWGWRTLVENLITQRKQQKQGCGYRQFFPQSGEPCGFFVVEFFLNARPHFFHRRKFF